MADKLERARQLGVLRDGWRQTDYMLDAAPKFGWLCNCIWGEKGSGKSNLMLQHGYAIFHGFDEFEDIEGTDENGKQIQRGIITDWTDMDAWNTTLEQTIFRPNDFAKMLSKVLDGHERMTWVGWDDINIHFPRSMYSTNRRIWEQFSKNWEGFRANLSIFECTAPRKDKIVSFVLSDMNWDTLISSRHVVETVRWYWDRDYYEPEKVLKFRVDVDNEEMDIYHVPKEVWDKYWERKIVLIDESTRGFQQMLLDLDKPVIKDAMMSHVCQVCDRDLGNSYNLKVHMSAHIKKGEYVEPS